MPSIYPFTDWKICFSDRLLKKNSKNTAVQSFIILSYFHIFIQILKHLFFYAVYLKYLQNPCERYLYTFTYPLIAKYFFHPIELKALHLCIHPSIHSYILTSFQLNKSNFIPLDFKSLHNLSVILLYFHRFSYWRIYSLLSSSKTPF